MDLELVSELIWKFKSGSELKVKTGYILNGSGSELKLEPGPN